ncbi:hypothetical protein GCM10020216_062050 [Nonomuraea helvata]
MHGHLPPEAGTRFRKFSITSDRIADGIDMREKGQHRARTATEAAVGRQKLSENK